MINAALLNGEFRLNRDYQNLRWALQRSFVPGRFKPLQIQGLCEGAEYTFLATLAEDVLAESETKGSSGLLVFCADEKEAKQLTAYLAETGLPAVFYPSRDYNFNHVVASHDYEHERLEILTKLNQKEPMTVVTTPEAAFQLTMTPERLAELTIKLVPNQDVHLEALIGKLIDAGYERVDLVEGEGQFAVRGGIIDIFPPSSQAVRLELFGDEIDRLGFFDPATQRFIEMTEEPVFICPSRELILTAEHRERITQLLLQHQAKLAKRKNQEVMVQNLIKEEIAAAQENLSMDYADKFLPIICEEGASLFSFFRGTLVLRDPSALESRARAQSELLDKTITELLENGEMAGIKTGHGYLYGWDYMEQNVVNAPSLYIDSFVRQGSKVQLGEAFNFATRHVVGYGGNMQLLLEDVAGLVMSGHMVAVLCANEVEQKEVIRVLNDEQLSAGNGDEEGEEFYQASSKKTYPIAVLSGEFRAGYEMTSPRFALLSFSVEATKLQRAPRKLKHLKAKNAGEQIMSYADLHVGDLVVHASYGIGMFSGIDTLTVGDTTKEYITIQYAGKDKLFLPVDQLDLVSKYIGAGADDGSVQLSKMNGTEWTRAKAKASKATKEMAHELVQLYARRKRTPGIAFDPDDDMSQAFAEAFEYEETESQLNAVEDIRRDMEAPCPMERLLCGDVGYGKTEVAIRAAFKAVSSGYQVAVLAPTTILAFQHFQTFQSRFRGFPCSVDLLSRFRTPKQQAATLRALKRGDVDVLIGTHRIISSDIEFKKLGLIIIDEEQRFGVGQKEKLKKMAPNVDVLTLTATPIPRTLNMAMSGITDMSLLDEAPGHRLPVQTYVLEHNEGILLEAMRRELKRGGQVFYLNNNIDAVYHIASWIQRELPDVRVAAAHGRMDKEELESVWAEMVKGEIDILVSTTIIETGIDVPNANTLIIENADHYGLSQLHQIRGRVGRSSRRAYAYLTYRPQKRLTDIAQKRLSAIKEYAAFGAGFRIALRDLEIRGAGNLLGAEQHGHMDAVGYDLYMRMLNEAVLEEKGEVLEKIPECVVSFHGDCYLPKNYIPSEAQRMDMYKRMVRIVTYEDYEDVIDEMCDRFGEPPAAAMNLCRVSLCRALGSRCGLKKIEETLGEVRLTPYQLEPMEVTALAQAAPGYALHVVLASTPYTAFRVKNAKKIVEATADLLRIFDKIRQERKQGNGV